MPNLLLITPLIQDFVLLRYGGLCREFLKASPSPALRACWTVAQRYAQLAKDLFNASFVSCWTELDANQQDELMSSLEKALTEPDLPEISQVRISIIIYKTDS